MDIIMLMVAFILMAGIAVLFCNLFHLNSAEGMILAVFIIIALDAVAIGLVGNYMAALLFAVLLSAGGLLSTFFKWHKEKTIRFDFFLSPYFIALTAVFVISLLIYFGDTIQNIDELGLWALADKYMCIHDKLYVYDGYSYIQGNSLFRYFFLKPAGFKEGSIYAVSGLLYWIGLLLPFGKLKKEKSPRILLYVLLLHIGLYSMYYYGSKSCGPELPLACWTGGLAGWWITRERKKGDAAVLIAGLLVAFSFTTSLDAVLVFFVVLLVLLQMVGSVIKDRRQEDLDTRNRDNHADAYCTMAAAVLVSVVMFLFSSITHFAYLEENMTNFLRCLVENNMTQGKSDLNYTFIFNAVLFMVLLVAAIDRKYQRQMVSRYIIYSVAVSIIYIAVLIFGAVDANIHVEEEYMVSLQRLIAMFVIYLFVMAISWMMCEERILERKVSYIPGLVLLVVFMYGVNADYLTNTTAAYPEKSDYYADIQQVRRECKYIQSDIPSDEKIYMINQSKEIASAEAKFILGNQVSDFSSQSWQFSVNGGMLGSQTAPYETIRKLPNVLTKGKYRYVWIYKTDEYLNTNLPMVMGDEAEDSSKTGNSEKKIKSSSADDKQTVKRKEAGLISSENMAGGQLYEVLYSKKKAKRLRLVRNIVPYENRETYYRWNDITK